MSEIDFSGRLPGPVTGRPRRPLSNSASTASWSIRFSLLTMISGAPRSSRRLRRLFRLITRRYRSFRSDVANRPPSSWTIGTQVRRDDRDCVQHHRLRRVGRGEERVDHLEALERTGLALAPTVADDLAQRVGLGLQVEALQALLDRRGAHRALEVVAVPVHQLAVEQLVALEVGDLEVLEAVPDLLEPLDLGVRTLADLRHLALGGVAHLAARVGLGALRLELGQVGLEHLGPGVDVGVAALGDLLLLQVDLVLEVGQVLGATVVVDLGDHVRGEVDDLLQVLRREVEQVAQARGHALEEPDVGHRGGELDVTHPLTAHLGASDLDAAALADDALEAHALVLAAVALPVPGGTEDLLAEEPVLLRLQGPVVDGLGLLDLTVRPGADVLRGRQADAQLVEDVDVEQGVLLPSCDVHAVCVLRPRTRPRMEPNGSDELRSPRCWRRWGGGTGRCPAPPPRGTPRRRSPSCRWTRRPRTAPRRSGTATASP